MIVLVPGLHLLDPETYALAAVMRWRQGLSVLDARDEAALSTIPAQRGAARHAKPATP